MKYTVIKMGKYICIICVFTRYLLPRTTSCCDSVPVTVTVTRDSEIPAMSDALMHKTHL